TRATESESALSARRAVLVIRTKQSTVWKDAYGKGILNSAGQYFDPPPMMDDSRPRLSIARNEPVFNPAIAINYQDAVNTDGFLGFTAGQVRVSGISASNESENNIPL